MTLDAATVALIGGLGGAAITGATALGISWLQANRAAKAERAVVARRAYARVLASSGLIVHTAHALHTAVEARSGIKEGVDVMLGSRKPIDPMELALEMRRDLEPLYDAWADLWTVGTLEAIRRGNGVIVQAADVVGSATSQGEARRGLIRLIAGEKWSAEQFAAWFREVDVLMERRREFASAVRQELGHEAVDFGATSSENTLPDAHDSDTR